MIAKSALAKNIQSTVEQKMSAISKSEIKNIEFQVAYSKAAAQAFEILMKGPAMGLGAAPKFTILPPGNTKGLTVKSSIIRDQAFNFFKAGAPKATNITKKFFEAVAEAIEKESKNVVVQSVSGFGGSVVTVIFPGQQMGTLIFGLLPSKFKRGQYMKLFCDSIGIGVQAAMLNAKSQEIPNAPVGVPPPTGPLIAKFS